MISISIVSRVKHENLLLPFQMKNIVFFLESQSSVVQQHILDRGMLSAPEGVIGTGDHP